ncbi:MAG: S41 family peptidase [Maribacter sp.]
MSLNKWYRLSAIVLITMVSNSLIAQLQSNGADSEIGKNLLLQDIQILKKNLEMVQPGLYNYTSKEDMETFFEELKGKITDDMSSIDFFRLIAPLSNLIKNGHTLLVPSSNWEEYVVTNAKLLPLDLYQYNGDLYVLRNVSDNTTIVEGSILKSINGKSAIDVFNYMVDCWFKDGYNLTRPREIVEEEYRLLFAHFYGANEKYDLEIINPSGESLSLEVNGIKESKFRKRLEERFDIEYVPWWRKKPEPLSFNLINETAYLKVTQFNNGLKSTHGERFGKFIKKSFKTIKQKEIRNLVLDLRGNGGGDVKPQLELLRHLVKEPFHLYKKVFANVRSLPNPEYYEFNILSKTQFKNNFSNEKVAGVYSMKERLGFESTPQEPSENLFNGNLYVLIDGWSFSATGEVSGIIKEQRKDAVFVGEETGGNPVTNISGIQTFMTLPNSKNRILICLVSYTADVSFKNDGHGVKPHYELRNSVFDVLNNKDVVIEKVNQLIAESKN